LKLLTSSGNSNYLTPLQVRNHLQLLWEKEQGILDSVLGVCPPGQRNRKSSSDNFFLDCILVPPAAFRPISRMGDKVFDHPQNTYLNAVIKFNNAIVALRAQEKENNRDISQVDNSFKLMISSWVSLQENANWFIDSSKNSKLKMPPAGIKQVMEKKEGLFRKHMMVSLLEALESMTSVLHHMVYSTGSIC
jgi:DNA-directed RNA polymerase I subunit RPA1